MSNTINYYQILTNLGYTLQDRGDYWQTSALYRGGDNPTALQIYKNTGVWKDYVSSSVGGGFQPFKALVEKSGGKFDSSLLEESYIPTNTETEQSSNISSEKIFPDSYVKSFLPHFDFYINKGISINILKSLNSGLSTEGYMYQRFVFPIFNKHGKAHGLAGRDLSNKDGRPKWKHKGKKTKWVYPYYSFDSFSSNVCQDSIRENREVILVESIGDMLSLFSRGFYNVLVTFGLDISPSLCSHLIGVNPKSIILSLNNDFNSDKNRGKNACIKGYLKLCDYFNHESISICLPVKNDFGDMNGEDYANWISKKDKNSKSSDIMCKLVLEEAQKLYRSKLLSKSIYNNIKFLKTNDSR